MRALEQAQRLHAQGRLSEAEEAYRRLATPGGHREAALAALTDLYLQSGRGDRAIETLEALTGEAPDNLDYYVRLGSTLERLGQSEVAIKHYQRYLARQPESPEAHFNLALIYKNATRYAEAEAEYSEAIRLGISNVQEAYSNLGVLYATMRQPEKAQQMYEKAIAIDPRYIPALFNLAGLYEEMGDKQRAVGLYRQILSIDARHWESQSRIAHASRVTSADDEIIGSLRRAINDVGDDEPDREGLYFALGKLLDDVERYDEAFDVYRLANEIGKLRNAPWSRDSAERAIGGLISLFDQSWLERTTTSCDASPIFVCGMFRSGSTLVEQILAAHPAIQTGGEFDYLPWLIARRFAPYPDRLRSISAMELERVAEEYVSKVRELFPDAPHVTDKRPDNFLHLGLIRAMFPSARIIYTKRNRRDNCLSVYFQQLGGNLGYATDFGDTAHYYEQHKRLMTHWQELLGDGIFIVDYDTLVSEPESLMRELLDFLGLPWDEKCLEFQNADALVKTASIWQVREPLYARSSGRWKNYEKYVAEIDGL